MHSILWIETEQGICSCQLFNTWHTACAPVTQRALRPVWWNRNRMHCSPAARLKPARLLWSVIYHSLTLKHFMNFMCCSVRLARSTIWKKKKSSERSGWNLKWRRRLGSWRSVSSSRLKALAERSPICFYIIADLYSHSVTSHFCLEYSRGPCQSRPTCSAVASSQRRRGFWLLTVCQCSACVGVLLTHFSLTVWWYGNQFFNPAFDTAVRQTPPLSTCHPAVLHGLSKLCYFNPVKLAKCLRRKLGIMIKSLIGHMVCFSWLVAVVWIYTNVIHRSCSDSDIMPLIWSVSVESRLRLIWYKVYYICSCLRWTLPVRDTH